MAVHSVRVHDHQFEAMLVVRTPGTMILTLVPMTRWSGSGPRVMRLPRVFPRKGTESAWIVFDLSSKTVCVKVKEEESGSQEELSNVRSVTGSLMTALKGLRTRACRTNDPERATKSRCLD